MLLRDHPLMSYKGVLNWPPAWVWLDGPEDKQPEGELEILRTALLSKHNRCFLLIFYEESSYMGCLLFDDEIFCCHLGGGPQNCEAKVHENRMDGDHATEPLFLEPLSAAAPRRHEW